MALCLAVMPGAAGAQQADDLNRIIDEGFNRSEVMQTAEHLTDGIGGRMTNSPQMRAAEEWTAGQFRAWGLANVHKEGFNFGRGWWVRSAHAQMVSPRPIALTSIPVAWTPATNGVVSAPVIVAPMMKERDFDAWRGKLGGKIVLISMPGDGSEPGEPAFKRLTSEDIAKRDKFTPPDWDPAEVEKRLANSGFARKLDAFLKAEGAVAWARISQRDGKLLHGTGNRFRVGDEALLPGVEIAAEDYRRLARLAKVGPAPVLEIASDVVFDDSDHNAYNIVAEIPGTDPKAGYVMAGAHLDSWAAGDGASDNAAGSSMIMEAARILSKLGIKPKRTIRFALWAGEEQGLLGSMAWVDAHLAKRALAPGAGAEGSMEQTQRYRYRFPILPQPGYGDLKAYFNIDNGSGRLRGIHAEGNVAAVPLLKEWLTPFASLGANSVAAQSTGSTDHVYIQAVGAPGFQFIQDPLDYGSRVHHTSIDTFDHLKAEDMRQGAVVLAGMLFQSANSAKTLPRKPLPTQPAPTDPFEYEDPSEN
ncbi:M20/M25/M40 family metallo-hydrolase [Sphingobium nicotianae]|uniref:Carboxypeptidase Q n=1 Tax=Sphingobium nicotianae TaxID=2782607 RepID=A0A9X1IT37_9SPHN|nr:M20/M25/M40 family metallo-hydrolase [Sphingobium nicotianae]